MSVELEGARYLCASVERLLTARGGFALPASPLQRAICRVLEGAPLAELGALPEVLQAFGGRLPDAKPKELAVFSGVRVGKSIIAAAAGLYWSQVIDVDHLRAGEVPRIPLVSTAMDNAEVIFDHVKGAVLASPWLSALLLEDPRNQRLLVRHPTGRPVEIKVVAGARAGSSLVSRWLGGIVFDEFPRMVGAADGVINWDEQRKAVALRILPGGGILDIGSPHAPFGPAYKMATEHLGAPTSALVVVKAPAFDMNPAWWTPAQCADAKAKDPDAYVTDVLAEFASLEESFFNGVELDRAARKGALELGPVVGNSYTAAMDPATRSNAWTLVIATREGKKKRVVFVKQWIGSRLEPLSSRAVLGEVARVCARYRITSVLTDQYYVDALRDIAAEAQWEDEPGKVVRYPLTLLQSELTEREKVEKWKALRLRLNDGDVELSPDPVYLADMRRVKRRVTQAGVTILLPETSDGRHCDYAPATLLALSRYLDDVVVPPPPEGSPEAARREEEAAVKAAIAKWGRKRR